MNNRYHSGMEPIPGYKIVDFLGEGSYGAVYKARGPGGVENALKFISLDNKQGLKEFKSVSLVKKLRHANLVPIHAIWLRDANGNVMDETTGGDSISINLMGNKELVIAMGLGDKSLADRLNEMKGKGIPADKLLRYMEDAAKGIDYLNEPCHEPNNSSIIHCDIKPGNLLIVGGSVQVCDYGVAKALQKKVDLKKTMGAGTPAYAAPELINNDPTPQTDQYSLAITYVELRTAFLPFEESKALVANLTGRLDLTRLDPAEQEVIRRATHMQTNKRYATCLEMVEELKVAAGITFSRTGVVPMGASRRQAVDPTGEYAPIRTLDDLLQKGEALVPGHTLVRRLGEGGYGQVWEARDDFNKPCALKIVRRSESKGHQEYEILSKIKQIEHRHLMEPSDIWLLANDGSRISGDKVGKPGAPIPAAVVIKTKLADKNLLQRMRECQQQGLDGIAPAELIQYMHQAGAAIDHLNANNIQHRDIKPENILLIGDQAYVSDFGLAKLVDDDGNATSSSSSGMTLDYAAPELLDEKRVTLWTDQYSLAISYIVLRTGRLPYPSHASQSQKIQARLNGQLDLSALSPGEREVLTTALERDPGRRFDSCSALASRLGSVLGLGSQPLGLTGSGPQPSLGSGTHPPMPSRVTPNFGWQAGSAPPVAGHRSPQHVQVEEIPVLQAERGSSALPAGRMGTVSFGASDTAPISPMISGNPWKNDTPAAKTSWKNGDDPKASNFFREVEEPMKRGFPIIGWIAAGAIVVGGGAAAAIFLNNQGGSSAVTSGSGSSGSSSRLDPERFNTSINSIKTFVAAGEVEKAQNAIAEFAKLEPPADLAKVPAAIQEAWALLDKPANDQAAIAAKEKDAKQKSAALPERFRTEYDGLVKSKLARDREAIVPDRSKYIAKLTEIQKLIADGKDATNENAAFNEMKPSEDLAKVPQELTKAWALLLKDEPKTADDIVKRNGEARSALKGMTEDFKAAYESDLKTRLTAWLDTIVVSLNDAPWKSLYEVCALAEHPLLAECWTERAISKEQNLPKEPTTKDAYASAVILDLRGKKSEAASAAVTLLGAKVPEAIAKSPRRAKRLQAILDSAAAEASDALKKSEWLAKSDTLNTITGRTTDSVWDRVKLKFRADPKAKDLKGLLDEVKSKRDKKQIVLEGIDEVEFWRIYAATRSPVEALPAYRELARLAVLKPSPITRKQFYEWVLAPIQSADLTGAKFSDDDLQDALALLRSSALMIRNDAVAWVKAVAFEHTPLDESMRLFKAAYAISKSPDDLAWQGLLLQEKDGKFPETTWKEFTELGGTGKSAVTETFRGLKLCQPAMSAGDYAARAKASGEARSAYLSAIDLAKNSPDILRIALRLGAENNILLANFTLSPGDARDPICRKALEEAAGWARRLIVESPGDADAHDSLGCALEDLAQLSKDERSESRFEPKPLDGRYLAAENEFGKALSTDDIDPVSQSPQLRAKAYVHRGRLRYKWAKDLNEHKREDQARSKLSEAIADLNQAKDLLKSQPPSYEKGECFLFLGNASALRKSFSGIDALTEKTLRDDAIGYYRNCLAEAKHEPARDLREGAVSSFCEFIFSEVLGNQLTDELKISELMKELDKFLTDDLELAPSQAVRSYWRILGRNTLANKGLAKLDDTLARELALVGLKGCPSQDRWTQPELHAMLGDLYANNKNAIYDAAKATEEYRAARDAAKTALVLALKVAPYEGKLGLHLHRLGLENSSDREKYWLEARTGLEAANLDAPTHPQAIRWRYFLAIILREIISKDAVKNVNPVQQIRDRADMAAQAIAIFSRDIEEFKASPDTAFRKRASDMTANDLKGFEVVYKRCLEEDALKQAEQVKPSDFEEAAWKAALAELYLRTGDDAAKKEARKLHQEAAKAYKNSPIGDKNPHYQKLVKEQFQRIEKLLKD